MLILRFFKLYLIKISKVFLLLPGLFFDGLLHCFNREEVKVNCKKHKANKLIDDENVYQLTDKQTAIYDISIIIPIYNVEKYLEECLESVLSQVDGLSVELILIEDRSTDMSFSIANRYSAQENVTLIQNKKNSGVSKSRNVGIKNANGKYLFF